MAENELSPVQKEILKVLNEHKEKALITEAVIMKKIRQNLKLEGKSKAGLALADLEAALTVFNTDADEGYSLILNSAHDLLLKKNNNPTLLEGDARKRRQASEKSISILTSSDLTARHGNKSKPKKRTDSKKLNIYSNFEEMDD